jgi:hypothetical protein
MTAFMGNALAIMRKGSSCRASLELQHTLGFRGRCDILSTRV